MSSAGECLAPHVRLLRAVGFQRRRDSGGAAALVNGTYRAVVLSFTTTFLVQESVYAYLERNDMDKLSRVMFLLLCHVTSIAKQVVFYVDADRIDDILHSLDTPLLNAARGAGRRIRTAATARRVLCAYAGCAVLVCHLWLVFPVLSRAGGHRVEFSFWTAFDTHPLPLFVPTLLYSHYVTTLVGIANTTMDGFMATILHQCKTQLEMLREDLRSLPERAKQECEENPGNYEELLIHSLVRCYKHYQMVTITASTFQDVFGTAIFIQVAVGAGILCMAAYKIASLAVASVEFASMILFIVCILTELFLYCYYGNELKVESGLVAGAAYEMRWVGESVRLRRLLLMVLLRASRELRPIAGGVVPLSLETYVKVPCKRWRLVKPSGYHVYTGRHGAFFSKSPLWFSS